MRSFGRKAAEQDVLVVPMNRFIKDNINRIGITVGMVIAIFLALSMFYNSEHFPVYTVWGDRDLWRGAHLLLQSAPLGPEYNSGYRSPGDFFYRMISAALAVDHNGRAVNVLLALMYVAAAMVIFWFARAQFGLPTAVFSSVFFLGSGFNLDLLYVWNPGFIPLFATISLVSMFLYLKNRRIIYAFLMFCSISLGMQIHSQIAIFFPILIVFLFVYRVRPTIHSIVAMIAGFILPNLNFFFFDLFNNFEYTLNLMGEGGVGHYFGDYYRSRSDPRHAMTIDDVIDKIGVLLTIFYRLFSGNETVPGQWFRVGVLARFSPGYYLVAGKDIVVALSILLLIGAERRAILREIADRAPRIGAPLLFVLVAFLILAFFDINPRHAYFVAPAAAILGGLAFARLVAMVRQKLEGWAGSGCGLALEGWVLFPGLVIAAIGFTSVGFQKNTFLADTELATHVKQNYFADRETFERRSSLVEVPGDGSQLVWNTHSLSFVFDSTAVSVVPAEPSDACLAVFGRNGRSGDEIKTIARAVLSTPLFTPMAARLDGVSMGVNLAYIAYSTRSGNCLKNLVNPYVPTLFERTYLTPKRVARRRTIERLRAGLIDIAPFKKLWNVETIPRNASGDDIFVLDQPPFDFPLGVVVGESGGSVHATIQGRLLRGKTGLPRRKLRAPVFRVRAVGGELITEVPVLPAEMDGKAALGDVERGLLAPWQVRLPRPGPDGYVLSFAANEEGLGDWEMELGKIAPFGSASSAR